MVLSISLMVAEFTHTHTWYYYCSLLQLGKSAYGELNSTLMASVNKWQSSNLNLKLNRVHELNYKAMLRERVQQMMR